MSPESFVTPTTPVARASAAGTLRSVPGEFDDELQRTCADIAQHWRDEKKHYLGHVFVDSKRHVAEVADLTAEESQAIGLYTSRIARARNSGWSIH